MKRYAEATYSHTQTGPWGGMLAAIGLGVLAGAWFARHETVAVLICVVIAALMLILASAFHHLTVADEGDHLAVRFGPLPLIGQQIRYSDIREVEIGRTTILEGWGVHMSPRGGWVWNIGGRDCVLIHRRKGDLRLGTDDVENLAEFLAGKIASLVENPPDDTPLQGGVIHRSPR